MLWGWLCHTRPIDSSAPSVWAEPDQLVSRSRFGPLQLLSSAGNTRSVPWLDPGSEMTPSMRSKGEPEGRETQCDQGRQESSSLIQDNSVLPQPRIPSLNPHVKNDPLMFGQKAL